MKPPVRVTVTGAAGQIGYALLFRIATGQMLGLDQPIIFQLLEMPQAMKALEGVAMEIDDCAFPLVSDLILTDDVNISCQNTNYALLVGARPRSAGMERADLLEANASIFKVQGKALNDHAHKDVKVVVIGNPANTNAHIAILSAPDLKPQNFTAMTRLDHNRALALLANKTKTPVHDIKKMTIWGNHSITQYPDITHTTISGVAAKDVVDSNWYQNDYISRVAKRGAEIIEARGLSSAASAANAAVVHVRDWILGTPEDDWVSMVVPSDGSYGIPENLMFSFPVTCKGGEYTVVSGLTIDQFSQAKIDATKQELQEEKDAVAKII